MRQEKAPPKLIWEFSMRGPEGTLGIQRGCIQPSLKKEYGDDFGKIAIPGDQLMLAEACTCMQLKVSSSEAACHARGLLLMTDDSQVSMQKVWGFGFKITSNGSLISVAANGAWTQNVPVATAVTGRGLHTNTTQVQPASRSLYT